MVVDFLKERVQSGKIEALKIETAAEDNDKNIYDAEVVVSEVVEEVKAENTE